SPASAARASPIVVQGGVATSIWLCSISVRTASPILALHSSRKPRVDLRRGPRERASHRKHSSSMPKPYPQSIHPSFRDNRIPPSSVRKGEPLGTDPLPLGRIPTTPPQPCGAQSPMLA